MIYGLLCPQRRRVALGRVWKTLSLSHTRAQHTYVTSSGQRLQERTCKISTAGHTSNHKFSETAAEDGAGVIACRSEEDHLVEHTLGYHIDKVRSFVSVLNGKETMFPDSHFLTGGDTIFKREPSVSRDVAVPLPRRKGDINQRLMEALRVVLTDDSSVFFAGLARDLGSFHGSSDAFDETSDLLAIIESNGPSLRAPINAAAATAEELSNALRSEPVYVYAVLLQLANRCMRKVEQSTRATGGSSSVTRPSSSTVTSYANLLGTLCGHLEVMERENKSGSELTKALWPKREWFASISTELLRAVGIMGTATFSGSDSKVGKPYDPAEAIVRRLVANSRFVCRCVSEPRAQSSEEESACNWPDRGMLWRSLTQVKRVLDLAAHDERQGAQRGRDLMASCKVTRATWLRELYLSHMIWLLDTTRGHLAAGYFDATCKRSTPPFTEGLNLLERLWHLLKPPLCRYVDDSQMCHRSTHSSLNLHIHHTRREVLRARAANVTTIERDSIVEFWQCHEAETFRLLHSAQQLITASRAALQRDRTNHLWESTSPTMFSYSHATSYALISRILLDVESHLSFCKAKTCCDEWTVPTRLGRFQTKRTPVISDWGDMKRLTEGDELLWGKVDRLCAKIRSRVAVLVREVFTVHFESEMKTTESRRGPRKPASAVFISMISTSFFSLMRRDYYMSHGGDDSDDSRMLLEASLQVFLLLREAALAFGEKSAAALSQSGGQGSVSAASSSEDAPPLQWSRYSVCGTTLSQSMEVSFFLTYYTSVWGSRADDPSALRIRPSDVQGYVKEMLLCLQLNTTKQLRHLRQHNVLHHFSGLRKDGTSFIEDEIVRRRHVQSVVGVVHAHVLHPSFLWMPLWQLQEMVFILSHHTAILYGDASSPASSKRDAVADTSDAAIALSTRQKQQQPVVCERGKDHVEHVQLRVGGITTEFSKAHGYLMLRLFVVSNALREYRDLLCEDIRKKNCQGAQSAMKQLERVASYEPEEEKRRRGRRTWPRLIAQGLLDNFTSAVREVEGVLQTERGAVLTLSRLESTVRTALDSGLVINVVKNQQETKQRRGTQPHNENGETALEYSPSSASGADEESLVTLEVTRQSISEPLGFVLDAHSARLLRVHTVSTDDGESPFLLAIQAAGLSDASRLLGYTVRAVDGVRVATGRDVIARVHGKHSFSLLLARERSQMSGE